MAIYPRILSRGKLKGEYVESRKDYRTKLARTTGAQTEYEYRKQKAIRSGFTSVRQRESYLRSMRRGSATGSFASMTPDQRRFIEAYLKMSPRKRHQFRDIVAEVMGTATSKEFWYLFYTGNYAGRAM